MAIQSGATTALTKQDKFLESNYLYYLTQKDNAEALNPSLTVHNKQMFNIKQLRSLKIVLGHYGF